MAFPLLYEVNLTKALIEGIVLTNSTTFGVKGMLLPLVHQYSINFIVFPSLDPFDMHHLIAALSWSVLSMS